MLRRSRDPHPAEHIGLLQYMAPVIQLALGVFVFDEPMPPSRLAGSPCLGRPRAAERDGLLAARRRRAVELRP
jgi:chloramphenicol-sensitive protein RarD